MAAAGIAAAVALSFHSPAQTAAAAAGPNPTPAAAAAQPAPAATAATAAPASVDATPPSGPVVVAPVQVEPIAVPVIAPPQAPAQRDDRRGGDPQPTDEGLPDAAPAESVEPTAPPASPETPDPGPVVDPGVGGGPKSGPLEPQAARLEVPIVPSFPGGQVDEGDRRTLVAFVHAGDEPRLVITGVPDGWTATFSGGCREGDGVSVCTLLDTVGTSPVTLDVALVDGAVPESGVATIALYSNDSNVPPADSYTVEFYGAPPTETPPAGPATEPDAPLAPPPGAPAAD